MSRIRVLVVDDSALVRQMLTEMLNGDPDIEVVGAAPDPYIAREKIKKLDPDVLTLDVEMPRMDGITFLRNLMRLRPMPVVMVSSLTERGADVTLQALELGAVDFVTKPRVGIADGLAAYADEIIAKVKTAAGVRVRALERIVRQADRAPAVGKQADGATRPRHFSTTDRIIAIGSSTGGTEAIREILVALPPDTPGILIAQHIPPGFSAAFARRMDGCSALSVCEAGDGQQVRPGHVYIAPGDRHLVLERNGARYVCRLSDEPPVNRHKPSVEVLFRSVARAAGHNAVGVMLTGMGADGAEAMRELRDSGAFTLAQDEESSVVWGMPGEAVRRGAVARVVPLSRMAGAMLEAVAGEGVAETG